VSPIANHSLYIRGFAPDVRKVSESVSKLSRLKEKKIRVIVTQYRTGSGPGSPAPGSPARQPRWGMEFGHFNSGLARAGGAREGSQGQAPERAAPGNLPNMRRALKAREDF